MEKINNNIPKKPFPFLKPHFLLKKQLKFLIPMILIALTLVGLSIAGVVLGSIDFQNQIYNAKSICFMVFGCLGCALFFALPFLSIIIGLIQIKQEKTKAKISLAAITFCSTNQKATDAEVINFAKQYKLPKRKFIKEVKFVKENMLIIEIIKKATSKEGAIDFMKLFAIAKENNLSVEQINKVLSKL